MEQELKPDLAALGLDGEVAQRVQDLIDDAQAQGYLRGRNEKIEFTQHFEVPPEAELRPAPALVVNHRSVWER
ncbi:MAG: hypothetical protein IJ775_01045 [Muribaculaceae bacterium]|nr:hypothetical protein [Muribaculaceae bacterium]